jgi:hypothetical protein
MADESMVRTTAFYNWAGMRSKDRTDEQRKAEQEGFEAGWDAAIAAYERRMDGILRPR